MLVDQEGQLHSTIVLNKNFNICVVRSVTLVGEKGRKVLKDVVKQAKYPVKSRVVPYEVVMRYKDKIRNLEKELKQIMKQEEEEKQVRPIFSITRSQFLLFS